MKSAVIRQAVLADLDDIGSVFDQYRQFQGKTADFKACRAFLRERFDHGESVVFLAFLDEQPVGIAQLYPSYSSTALARVFILNDLFVSEVGRRAGVATALLQAERMPLRLRLVSLNKEIPHVRACCSQFRPCGVTGRAGA